MLCFAMFCVTFGAIFNSFQGIAWFDNDLKYAGFAEYHTRCEWVKKSRCKYCKRSITVCLCGFSFCCWSFICCDKNLHALTEPESSQYVYTAVKMGLTMLWVLIHRCEQNVSMLLWWFIAAKVKAFLWWILLCYCFA